MKAPILALLLACSPLLAMADKIAAGQHIAMAHGGGRLRYPREHEALAVADRHQAALAQAEGQSLPCG